MLRAQGLASVWAPASQESSHVGDAGVEVVSMKGAPVALPTSATAQFQRFFDTGPCGEVFALLPCLMEQGRWLKPHLAVRSYFDCRRWTCQKTQPIQRTPLWPAAWLSAVDKSRGSNSVELQRVWEMFDDRLQFTAVPDAVRLDDASRWEDVSDAWMVWSGEAMTALADACCFAGGPVPDRGLVPGRRVAQFRVVRLGGPPVRKARNNVAGPLDGGDVFMYRLFHCLPIGSES